MEAFFLCDPYLSIPSNAEQQTTCNTHHLSIVTNLIVRKSMKRAKKLVRIRILFID